MSAKLQRILRIYNRLRRGPLTIEVASLWAKSAGICVSDRQLYRDLNMLGRLKVADDETVVEFTDEKNRKVWKLEYAESNAITQYDLNSFFLFRNFIPFTIHEHRKDSFEKLEQILYRSLSRNRYQQYVEANELLLNRSNFHESIYGAEEHSKIEDLLWAVQNKRLILVEADVLNAAQINLSPEDFPVSMLPLELLFHRGRVYVCGLQENQAKYLAFAVDKGLQYKLTNNGFDHKKHWPVYQKIFDKVFGITQPFEDKPYKIKVEYQNRTGENLKSYFLHPSQKWKKLANGNYMLEMKCGIGSELLGFLAESFDRVVVHQPEVLKDLLVSELLKAVSGYRKEPVKPDSLIRQ